MRRRTWLIGSALSVVVATGFAACKLDLDEGLIPNDDGGPPDSVGGSAGSAGWGSGGSSGVGGFGAAPGDAGPCDADPQCAIDGGCLEGRCVSGACSYGVCPSSAACEGRSCDFGAQTCGEPKPLAFKVNQIDVGAELGCGGVTQRCIASVGDYVVIGTSQSSLLAWHVGNPLSPVPVKVEAPPFAITRLVSNGNRLLIVGVSQGGKLSLAWIDAPASTIPVDLVSKAVAVNFSGSFSAAYPADNDDFFLVTDDSAQFFPTARLDLPIAANATITAYPATGIPAGESVVGASGSRIVGYRTDTSAAIWKPVFSLETQAGTSSAQNAGEQSLGPEAPPSLGAHVFASAHDGSLLWSTNRVVRDEAGTVYADAVILRWVLVGTSESFDASPAVVLETYPSYGTDESRSGPSAVIDANKAIATAAYPADTSQSTVRGVVRAGAVLSLATGSDVVPFAKGALGVVATRRFGFVLTPSTTAAPDPPNSALRIYAPGCEG